MKKLHHVTCSNVVILFHGVIGDHAVSPVSPVSKNVSMVGHAITRRTSPRDDLAVPAMDFIPTGPHGMAAHKHA